MSDRSTTEIALDRVLAAIEADSRKKRSGAFWVSLLSPFMTLLIIVTASVIFVRTTSEREGAEEAQKVVAPLEAKIDGVEAKHDASLGAIAKSIEAAQIRTEKQLDAISSDVSDVAAEQRVQGEKLHDIDKKQVAIDATLRAQFTTPTSP